MTYDGCRIIGTVCSFLPFFFFFCYVRRMVVTRRTSYIAEDSARILIVFFFFFFQNALSYTRPPNKSLEYVPVSERESERMRNREEIRYFANGNETNPGIRVKSTATAILLRFQTVDNGTIFSYNYNSKINSLFIDINVNENKIFMINRGFEIQ